MANSEVAICNLALARVGVTMQIQSMTERTKEAVSCALIYEQTRDRVLSAAPWPFARATIDLQQTGTPPSRWAYRYQYPGDCLKLRAVFPPMPAGLSPDAWRLWLQINRVRFELSDGSDGNLTLCTDLEQAQAEYTRRITNPLRFSAEFTSALAWALAVEIALPLARGIDYSQNASAAYLREVGEALAQALNEEPAPQLPESEFVQARL